MKEKGFYENVWEVVKLIPKGRVTSYGSIANYLGTGMSARMVGYAMNACPPEVPAQRVLNRNGMLTGKHHFPQERSMEQLLDAEGVKVENDMVLNFEQIFWDPNIELAKLL